MNTLATHAQTLPEGWKWTALFTPPEGFETKWRSWLAQAQHAEEASLLAWWSLRAVDGGGDGDDPAADGGDLLAA